MRCSNFAPTLRSSSATYLLTSLFERPSRWPAAVNEPLSTTATNVLMPSMVSILIRDCRRYGDQVTPMSLL